MQIERFQALADAYGGDIRRWPGELRGPAVALAEQSAAARAILARAEALDAQLDAWRVAAPSAALRDAVLAQAPRLRVGWVRSAGLWLSGAGLAAACAAGVVFGVAASTAVTDDVRAETVLDVVLAEEAATPIGVSVASRVQRS